MQLIHIVAALWASATPIHEEEKARFASGVVEFRHSDPKCGSTLVPLIGRHVYLQASRDVEERAKNLTEEEYPDFLLITLYYAHSYSYDGTRVTMITQTTLISWP